MSKIHVEQEKGKSIVYEGGLKYSTHNTLEQAMREASLLKKAVEISDAVERYVETLLENLTQEQLKYLIKYAGTNLGINAEDHLTK